MSAKSLPLQAAPATDCFCPRHADSRSLAPAASRSFALVDGPSLVEPGLTSQPNV
jgi:hypothetical protein